MVDVVAALGRSDCEWIRSGWLAQPVNAVSSLAYVAVGGWLLWRSWGRGVRRRVLVAGSTALAAVGVGNFAYHGPQPGWAHPAHDASVVWLAAVVFADNVWLLARSNVRCAVGYAAVWAFGALFLVATGREVLLTPFLAAAVLAGGALAWRAATGMSAAAWRASAAWMVLALVAYWAGRTGSPLCHPASWWQPHAAWHALGAAGLGLAVLGCSARSDRDIVEIGETAVQL